MDLESGNVGEVERLPISATHEGPRETNNSLAKMLGILDLFTPERPMWSTNDLILALQTSRSTAYRYIKGLHAVGLLSAVGNGFYVLGPRIVELDFQIRRCDPLHQASKGVLEDLAGATGHSALLCMLFSSSVLCIRESLAPLSPENMFSRGQRRPLFKGAVSKVILPYLPNHRLKSIFERNRVVVREANLGETWPAFRDTLARFRRDGYVRTFGEFNPGVHGIAAPVFNSERLIIGSIGVAWVQEGATEVDVSRNVTAVKSAAEEITSRMSTSMAGLGLSPRAVG